MSGYDYGNARLRAMKARLLSRVEVEALAEMSSLQALTNKLVKTAYRRSVESALMRVGGMACITEALSRDLAETLGKMRSFYGGRAGEQIAVMLRAYDVHNLKTILRGLSKNALPEEMNASLLPVGELTAGLLAQLARVPEPRAAIDQLASMRLPIAQPLVKLRAEWPGAGLREMELALDQWRFQEARARLQESRGGNGLLSDALDAEIDQINLLTTLRFVYASAERQVLQKRLGSDDLSRYFVGPGRLSFELLNRAATQDTLEAATEILSGLPYERLLQAGLSAYKCSGRLSDFETHLRASLLRWKARLVATDPLGIGVPLGYSALKVNEVANLRWLARGIHLELGADAIKAELEFVS
jgi:V/A-type H+-transporting ATPase subunit C